MSLEGSNYTTSRGQSPVSDTSPPPPGVAPLITLLEDDSNASGAPENGRSPTSTNGDEVLASPSKAVKPTPTHRTSTQQHRKLSSTALAQLVSTSTKEHNQKSTLGSKTTQRKVNSNDPAEKLAEEYREISRARSPPPPQPLSEFAGDVDEAYTTAFKRVLAHWMDHKDNQLVGLMKRSDVYVEKVHKLMLLSQKRVDDAQARIRHLEHELHDARYHLTQRDIIATREKQEIVHRVIAQLHAQGGTATSSSIANAVSSTSGFIGTTSLVPQLRSVLESEHVTSLKQQIDVADTQRDVAHRRIAELSHTVQQLQQRLVDLPREMQLTMNHASGNHLLMETSVISRRHCAALRDELARVRAAVRTATETAKESVIGLQRDVDDTMELWRERIEQAEQMRRLTVRREETDLLSHQLQTMAKFIHHNLKLFDDAARLQNLVTELGLLSQEQRQPHFRVQVHQIASMNKVLQLVPRLHNELCRLLFGKQKRQCGARGVSTTSPQHGRGLFENDSSSDDDDDDPGRDDGVPAHMKLQEFIPTRFETNEDGMKMSRRERDQLEAEEEALQNDDTSYENILNELHGEMNLKEKDVLALNEGMRLRIMQLEKLLADRSNVLQRVKREKAQLDEELRHYTTKRFNSVETQVNTFINKEKEDVQSSAETNYETVCELESVEFKALLFSAEANLKGIKNRESQARQVEMLLTQRFRGGNNNERSSRKSLGSSMNSGSGKGSSESGAVIAALRQAAEEQEKNMILTIELESAQARLHATQLELRQYQNNSLESSVNSSEAPQLEENVATTSDTKQQEQQQKQQQQQRKRATTKYVAASSPREAIGATASLDVELRAWKARASAVSEELLTVKARLAKLENIEKKNIACEANPYTVQVSRSTNTSRMYSVDVSTNTSLEENGGVDSSHYFKQLMEEKDKVHSLEGQIRTDQNKIKQLETRVETVSTLQQQADFLRKEAEEELTRALEQLSQAEAAVGVAGPAAGNKGIGSDGVKVVVGDIVVGAKKRATIAETEQRHCLEDDDTTVYTEENRPRMPRKSFTGEQLSITDMKAMIRALQFELSSRERTLNQTSLQLLRSKKEADELRAQVEAVSRDAVSPAEYEERILFLKEENYTHRRACETIQRQLQDEQRKSQRLVKRLDEVNALHNQGKGKEGDTSKSGMLDEVAATELRNEVFRTQQAMADLKDENTKLREDIAAVAQEQVAEATQVLMEDMKRVEAHRIQRIEDDHAMELRELQSSMTSQADELRERIKTLERDATTQRSKHSMATREMKEDYERRLAEVQRDLATLKHEYGLRVKVQEAHSRASHASANSTPKNINNNSSISEKKDDEDYTTVNDVDTLRSIIEKEREQRESLRSYNCQLQEKVRALEEQHAEASTSLIRHASFISQSKEGEVNSLQASLATVKNRSKTLQEENVDLKAKLVDMQHHLDNLEDKYNMLEVERDDLEADLAAMRSVMSDAVKGEEALKERNVNSSVVVTNLEGAIASLESKVRSVERERDRVKTAHDEVLKRCSDAERRVEALVHQLSSKGDDVVTLLTRATDAEARVAELEERNTLDKEYMETLRGRLQKVEGILMTTEAERDTAREESKRGKEDVLAELATEKHTVARLQFISNEYWESLFNSVIFTVGEELASDVIGPCVHGAVAAFQVKMNELQTTRDVLAETNKKVADTLQTLDSTTSKHVHETTRLGREINVLNDTIEECERKRDEFKATVESQSECLKSVEERLTTTVHKLDDSEKHVAALEEELAATTQKLMDANYRVAGLTDECANQSKLVDIGKEQLKKAIRAHEDAVRREEALKSAAADARKEGTKKTERLIQLEAIVAATRTRELGGASPGVGDTTAASLSPPSDALVILELSSKINKLEMELDGMRQQSESSERNTGASTSGSVVGTDVGVQSVTTGGIECTAPQPPDMVDALVGTSRLPSAVSTPGAARTSNATPRQSVTTTVDQLHLSAPSSRRVSLTVATKTLSHTASSPSSPSQPPSSRSAHDYQQLQHQTQPSQDDDGTVVASFDTGMSAPSSADMFREQHSRGGEAVGPGFDDTITSIISSSSSAVPVTKRSFVRTFDAAVDAVCAVRTYSTQLPPAVSNMDDVDDAMYDIVAERRDYQLYIVGKGSHEGSFHTARGDLDAQGVTSAAEDERQMAAADAAAGNINDLPTDWKELRLLVLQQRQFQTRQSVRQEQNRRRMEVREEELKIEIDRLNEYTRHLDAKLRHADDDKHHSLAELNKKHKLEVRRREGEIQRLTNDMEALKQQHRLAEMEMQATNRRLKEEQLAQDQEHQRVVVALEKKIDQLQLKLYTQLIGEERAHADHVQYQERHNGKRPTSAATPRSVPSTPRQQQQQQELEAHIEQLMANVNERAAKSQTEAMRWKAEAERSKLETTFLRQVAAGSGGGHGQVRVLEDLNGKNMALQNEVSRLESECRYWQTRASGSGGTVGAVLVAAESQTDVIGGTAARYTLTTVNKGTEEGTQMTRRRSTAAILSSGNTETDKAALFKILPVPPALPSATIRRAPTSSGLDTTMTIMLSHDDDMYRKLLVDNNIVRLFTEFTPSSLDETDFDMLLFSSTTAKGTGFNETRVVDLMLAMLMRYYSGFSSIFPSATSSTFARNLRDAVYTCLDLSPTPPSSVAPPKMVLTRQRRLCQAAHLLQMYHALIVKCYTTSHVRLHDDSAAAQRNIALSLLSVVALGGAGVTATRCSRTSPDTFFFNDGLFTERVAAHRVRCALMQRDPDQWLVVRWVMQASDTNHNGLLDSILSPSSTSSGLWQLDEDFSAIIIPALIRTSVVCAGHCHSRPDLSVRWGLVLAAAHGSDAESDTRKYMANLISTTVQPWLAAVVTRSSLLADLKPLVAHAQTNTLYWLGLASDDVALNRPESTPLWAIGRYSDSDDDTEDVALLRWMLRVSLHHAPVEQGSQTATSMAFSIVQTQRKSHPTQQQDHPDSVGGDDSAPLTMSSATTTLITDTSRKQKGHHQVAASATSAVLRGASDDTPLVLPPIKGATAVSAGGRRSPVKMSTWDPRDVGLGSHVRGMDGEDDSVLGDGGRDVAAYFVRPAKVIKAPSARQMPGDPSNRSNNIAGKGVIDGGITNHHGVHSRSRSVLMNRFPLKSEDFEALDTFTSVVGKRQTLQQPAPLSSTPQPRVADRSTNKKQNKKQHTLVRDLLS